jgi:hypothetical protein
MQWSFLRRERLSAKSFCIGRLQVPRQLLENLVWLESRLWRDGAHCRPIAASVI